MMVQAVLEPMPHFPGSFIPLRGGDGNGAGMPVPWQRRNETRWYLELEPWSGDIHGLPTGLVCSVAHPQGLRRIQGHMPYSDLTEWIHALTRLGHEAEALALNTALQSHLESPAVLRWGAGQRFCLDFSRPRIMGILNLTPDSFSGDGVAHNVAEAVAKGIAMAHAGADVIDVGGESTRPGAMQVVLEEELSRVIPVIAELARRLAIPISVDTTKPEVMEAALEAGAGMVNDVSALGGADGDERTALDQSKVALLKDLDLPICLMHRQGTPGTMQNDPHYQDVLWDIYRFLDRRIGECCSGGIDKKRLLADVGFGFGKRAGDNLALMWHQRMFLGLGVPLLFGISRKRITGLLCGAVNPESRDTASHILAVFGMLTGARMFRVHDVAGARQAMVTAWEWMNDEAHLNH